MPPSATFTQLAESLQQLFSRGGIVLWALAGLSALLWVLALEKLLAVRAYEKLSKPEVSALKPSLRIPSTTDASLSLIEAIVHILPLVGLLGTVVGMIHAFDVLSASGGSDPKGLAEGISQALITTLAGLVTSLSGLLMSGLVARRIGNLEPAQSTSTDSPMALSPLLVLRERIVRGQCGRTVMDPHS